MNLKLEKHAIAMGSLSQSPNIVSSNDQNTGFYGYIGNWILWIYRIYRRYIGGYFYINIDKIKINKNKNILIENNIHNNLYRDSFVIVFKSIFFFVFYQIHAFC